MTDTQHLQKIILSIAKDIDVLCRKHNIPYYLFGGSALGAKRHKGFIPWDDDLDIVFLPEDYKRFLSIAQKELDPEKYQLQIGRKDWPEHFSKVRLKGTHIREYGEYYIGPDSDGIYVDIFRIDYASNSSTGRRIQYLLGKMILANNMNHKGYKPDSTSKKLMSIASKVLNIKPIRNVVEKIYYRYDSKPTNWTSDVMGRTRMHNAFIPREVYGKPVYVDFEDTQLPVHEDVDKYLTISFGDYMKLPPVEKRVGLHITHIDFGKF